MLGGSFWIAFLRNTISASLMMTLFLMIDRPKFSMKKTIKCYLVFGILMTFGYSLWYLFSTESFVRYASLSSILVIGIFCGWMSGGVFYFSLYKMAVAFYMFTVCTFFGVDVARWWFHGNVWVDIGVRLICAVLILILTWKKIRVLFLDGEDFLMEEMDLFSAVALFVSILIGAVVAYWPNLHGFSVFDMVRALVTLFMAGVLQYTILYLYLHLGQAHYLQREKELLEVNEQLLHYQLELMKESEKEAARIRHDARHHNLLIREYVRKEEFDDLVTYLDQYTDDVENRNVDDICRNRAVNSILSVYAARARSRNIQVTTDVRVAEDLPIRDIDWVAILANIFENAIHGCIYSEKKEKKIDIYMAQKGKKVIIQFCNTSRDDIVFKKGVPVSIKGSGVGVSSIMKTASRYDGEADFSVKDGQFITRILLNLPA